MKKKTRSTLNQKVITPNMTLEESELEVYKYIQQGKNYREIAQVEFLINNTIRRFNPSQIHKIKEKFEPKIVSSNQDPDKALVFNLFKKGTSPTDVLIQTGLSFEFVDKAYAEFLEFEKKVVVPAWFEEYLYDLAFTMRECDGLNEVYACLKEAVDSYVELQKHVYSCSQCGEPIKMREKSLEDAMQYLSSKWHHTVCP